jgi:CheY-like chemotaxis protein
MAPSNKPKVLVVDDEHVIADTLAIILNQSGFDASAVYSGTDAVERARRTTPDLVITDVFMPDLNGIQAAIQNTVVSPTLQDTAVFRPGRHRRPAGKCPRPGTRV